jgi:DNA polymerase bacteriophage-type
MTGKGIDIVAHIHDEAVSELPVGKYTVQEICDLMSENPDWCRDLPLAAAGYKGFYYFKD